MNICSKWELIKTDKVESISIKEFDISIKDARSAAFYGLGRVNSTENKVAVFCKTSEVASMLTAVTEAFYQNVPLIIVSIGNEEENAKMAECFESVTEKTVWCENDSTILDKMGEEKFSGPVLILCNSEEKTDTTNSDIHKLEVIEQLKKIENPNFRILVSNVDIVENPKIRLYKESEGYIYEFFGTSVANKNEQQVLIATYSQISQNLNAFNLRYIPQNVIIICLDSKIRNHKQWFENNGFTYIELTDINKLADNICFEKNKKIIYYKLG